MLWALTRRDLFAPGLAQAGLTPDRLLYAECRNDEEVLAVMEEGVRHGSLAAVVGEVGRAGDGRGAPAPARRRGGRRRGLAAAALAQGGCRSARHAFAALTRWRIGLRARPRPSPA